MNDPLALPTNAPPKGPAEVSWKRMRSIWLLRNMYDVPYPRFSLR